MDIIDKIKQIEHMNKYGFYIPKDQLELNRNFDRGDLIMIYDELHSVLENGDTYIKVVKIGGE